MKANMKANHLPKYQKLLLRKLMFNRLLNDSLINECLDKYDFKIEQLNELDNDLPLYYRGYNLTDKQVKMLGRLHTLELSHCPNITEESVKMLGGLHTFILAYCPNITDESVKMLGGLHTLELIKCPNITDESIKMLGGLHTLELWLLLREIMRALRRETKSLDETNPLKC